MKAQLCPTLCDPMDYTVHGILQARILEWAAMSSSRGSSQPRDWTHLLCLLPWQAGSLPLTPHGKSYIQVYKLVIQTDGLRIYLFMYFCFVVQSLSHVWLFVTPWTVVCQAPLTMGFSRQEYWSGVPFPSPGDLPNPGIKLCSPSLQQILYNWAPRMQNWWLQSTSYIFHLKFIFKYI